VPRISVIVPIHNGVSFLPAFFDSLICALPDNAELVLVDDGSTEAVWEAVPEFPASCRVTRLSNDVNMGYSAAVNRAFAVASGEIIVQLNTDLILDRRCIAAMIKLIEREQRVGVVGSKLVYPTTGLVQHVGMAFGTHTKTHIYANLAANHPLCMKTRETQAVTGATVATTRRVLNLLGPLDEGYFNHNEDIEHCLIARNHGLRNFMCSESVAHHWESQSGPARFAQTKSSEAIFWSRWAASITVDLDSYIDEALDDLIARYPDLDGVSFQLLDLTRGIDNALVTGRLIARWPQLETTARSYRQMNNPQQRLSIALLLPHWVGAEPVPFIYLVDRHEELEYNALWFASRDRLVRHELVVDLTGAVIPTSELRR